LPHNPTLSFVLATPKYDTPLTEEKAREFEEMLAQPNSEAAWLILLRAADKFHTAHGHYPGHFDEQVCRADVCVMCSLNYIDTQACVLAPSDKPWRMVVSVTGGGGHPEIERLRHSSVGWIQDWSTSR
jgi:hypothetical protein